MPPTSSPGPSSPSVGPSFDNHILLTDSPVEQRELDPEVRKNLESINIQGQLQWEKHMKDVDLKRRYRKVSVLLIHWEKEGTDSFDAQKEVCPLFWKYYFVSDDNNPQVDQLGRLFKRRYKFRVTERKLNTQKSAQLQIHMHLATWVCNEDDENTLLILYYAGHGTPDRGTGRLLLAK